MDNKTLINELREVRKLLSKATYNVALSYTRENDTTETLVQLSEASEKVDILLIGITEHTTKYPIDNVPLTDKERFWRGFKK